MVGTREPQDVDSRADPGPPLRAQKERRIGAELHLHVELAGCQLRAWCIPAQEREVGVRVEYVPSALQVRFRLEMNRLRSDHDAAVVTLSDHGLTIALILGPDIADSVPPIHQDRVVLSKAPSQVLGWSPPRGDPREPDALPPKLIHKPQEDG